MKPVKTLGLCVLLLIAPFKALGENADTSLKLILKPNKAWADNFRLAQDWGLDIKGDLVPDLNIKPYKSKSIGKRKRWILDRGAINDDQPYYRSHLKEDDLDIKSGIRLRLPRRR